MKVLVIDENEEQLCRIERTLRCAGYEAALARNNVQAMALLAGDRFEVLLVGIVMPALSGVDMVRSLRREDPDLRIVAMSGEQAHYPAAAGLKAAQAVGADAILYRPFSDETLLSALFG